MRTGTDRGPTPLAHVTCGDASVYLRTEQVLTFGRSARCTVCLDPDDLGISRIAGSLRRQCCTWWLTNESTKWPLRLADPAGIELTLGPSCRHAIAHGRLEVVVEGGVLRHCLQIVVFESPQEELGQPAELSGLPTDTPRVRYSEEDREALRALFGPALEAFPRRRSQVSYGEAASMLGWPRTTLIKKVEHMCNRLSAAGVPGLHGPERRKHLGEYVIATGVVTAHDVEPEGDEA